MITKTCTLCNIEKPITLFTKDNRKLNGFTTPCKECLNKRKQERRLKNPDKNLKEKAINYKGGMCESCGILYNKQNACIFEFHHLNPLIKDNNPSQYKYCSWEKFKSEIDKCVMLCANCHRLEHHGK